MLPVTNSAGIQSAVIPRAARAAAVLGPIAQTLQAASDRLSLSATSSRSQNASTPLVLVNMIQVKLPTSAMAASNGAGSSTGRISMVGYSSGTAPSSTSRDESALACWR